MESDDTKTAVTDEGIFAWATGDQVWLQTSNGSTIGTLSGGEGTANATFSYDNVVGGLTGLAIYPYNGGHAVSEGVLSVLLPSSYDLGSVTDNTNAVMVGRRMHDLPPLPYLRSKYTGSGRSSEEDIRYAHYSECLFYSDCQHMFSTAYMMMPC